MRFHRFLFAFLFALVAGAGARAGEEAGLPAQCNEMPSEPDRALVAARVNAPLDGFDPAPVCAGSMQSPLAKGNAAGDVCTSIYTKLSGASKQLKQALAAAGERAKEFKLDCNDTPEKCRNFYDQNAEQLKAAEKSEAELQQKLKLFMNYAAELEAQAGKKGNAYRTYANYASKVSDELNRAQNFQQASARPELNGAQAMQVNAPNLGEAWKKLTGVAYDKSKPVDPKGGLFQELELARLTAGRAKLYAFCRMADSQKKLASLGGNVKKLGEHSRNSGPAGQLAAGKGAGDKSTITGDPSKGTSAPTASQGGGGSGGDPMGAASKMMQQAAQLAGQMNQKGGGQGGGSASASNPAMPASSTSATPAATASTQPTSYSFANTGGPSAPSSGVAQPAPSSGSSQPSGDGAVAFNTGTPSPSAAASPSFTSGAARSGASGRGGATPASASASGGGSANVSSGAVGGPSTAGADPQSSTQSNDTGASVAGGGGMPSFSGGPSSGGGGGSGGGGDAGSLKALDAQFNAASANLGSKFDLAPLPALPPLDGNVGAAPATSATPPSTGSSAAGFAEQIPGLDAAVADAAAGTVAPGPQADAGQASPASQARTGASARVPSQGLSASPAFLGSDNVSLFQRIHSTSERAIRRITHPVAAAL